MVTPVCMGPGQRLHPRYRMFHQLCTKSAEEQEKRNNTCRKGGLGEEEIQHHLTQIKEVKNNTRKLRTRGKVDYKKLSGEKITKPKERRKQPTKDHDDQIKVIQEVTKAIQQRDTAID